VIKETKSILSGECWNVKPCAVADNKRSGAASAVIRTEQLRRDPSAAAGKRRAGAISATP
jgi:hypothetical protein